MLYQVYVGAGSEARPCRVGGWDSVSRDFLTPPPSDEENNPFAIFTTGEEANDFRKAMARLFPRHKYTVKRLAADKNWRERERERVESGHYKPVPWAKERWAAKHADHFPHMATKAKGKIAFTENEEKGMADRQTPISPGRYLTTYYADVLTPTEIEILAGKVVAEANGIKVNITQKAAEIKDVYLHGPSSCMDGAHARGGDGGIMQRTGPKADVYGAYTGKLRHPAEVYAGPDLAVAYLGDRKSALARVVVWPEKKRIVGKMYGDWAKLETMLKALGYTYGTADGARVQRIGAYANGYALMPYIDSVAHGNDEGDYIRLGSTGPMGVRATGGLTRLAALPVCGRCHSAVSGALRLRPVIGVDGRGWCSACRTRHAFRCDQTGDFYSSDADMVTLGGSGVTVHNSQLQAYGAVQYRGEWWDPAAISDCEVCGETGDGAEHQRVSGVGRHVCETCRADEGLIQIARGLRAIVTAADWQATYDTPFSTRFRPYLSTYQPLHGIPSKATYYRRLAALGTQQPLFQRALRHPSSLIREHSI